MDLLVSQTQILFQLINLIVQKLHLLLERLLLVEIVFKDALCVHLIEVLRDEALVVLIVEFEASR